jgi:hypothetical protein
MSVQSDLIKISVPQFAGQLRDEMIPLSSKFSYFSMALPLSEEDIKEYLHEPIAAIPAGVIALLPQVSILLVPYVERGKEKKGSGAEEYLISIEKPSPKRMALMAQCVTEKGAALVFAVKGQEVGEYHYRFYQSIAALAGARWDEEIRKKYFDLLWEEMRAGAHGEVDEESWRLKQSMPTEQLVVRRATKNFLRYAQQSFVDTLTLYLHGICCDIDLEAGPRQLASRWVRKRLELLQVFFPPPKGYAVFPEDLDAK